MSNSKSSKVNPLKLASPSFLNHLCLRTENSFQLAVGKHVHVLEAIDPGCTHAGIADRDGTWGHVKWKSACKERGVKPIYGAEIAVVRDMEERTKQRTDYFRLLARNNAGLRELYDTVTLSTEKFYYNPRIDYTYLQSLSDNILILTGSNPDFSLLKRNQKNIMVELNALAPDWIISAAGEHKYPVLATGDNLYPSAEDLDLYDVVLGDWRESRTSPGHILSCWEWLTRFPGMLAQIEFTNQLCKEFTADLPTAELVHPKKKMTLLKMCQLGAVERRLDLKKPAYRDRLKRELDLIETKKFEDYFFIVADMIAFARTKMLVGPARGSSCGSLVCYLIGITDIDPIPFDLLFERFIDINREDYPDIDIDFQDTKREEVFTYMREVYGAENVARLGTINFYKAKSALGDCAKVLGVPEWKITDLKNSIVERSSGDSRAAFCILDTFSYLEIGRKTLAEFPELKVSAKMEGHSSHTGKHAAGIVVTKDPVKNYCAIDHHKGVAMLDKKDAEKLNLLKIDALGLRVLSIIQDVLDQIGQTGEKGRQWLLRVPLDDQKSFAILNESKFAGIFQFEGYALQSLCRQMKVKEFEDVAVLTALARPGPLSSGGTQEFIKRRSGEHKVAYLHPLAKEITEVTFGVIIYQEQVMQIARQIGALSWENVSELRKAMSKSMGKEFFNKYWELFWKGAREKGISQEKAQEIWDNINTMGSWAFNRSHAIAYGMVSYWCCYLKANHPLEFAAACLRNAKDDDQAIKILRELVTEGYSYKAYDPIRSQKNWSVQDGALVGGLTGIKGIGDKLADSIIRKRAEGIALGKRETTLLAGGKTPWDVVFECTALWGHLMRNPGAYNIASEIVTSDKITEDSNGEFLIIAKMQSKALRDHNETKALEKRGGKRMEGQTQFLNLVLEDDCGTLMAGINRFNFIALGKPLIEDAKVGEWFMWKGKNRAGFRRLSVNRWKKLSGNSFYADPENKLKKDVEGQSAVNETADAMNALNAKKTGPVPTGDNLDEYSSWYNGNSGRTKKVKFSDLETAKKKCKELEDAIDSLSSTSGAKKVSKKGAAKAAAKAKQQKKTAKKGGGTKKDEGAGPGRKSNYAGKLIYKNVDGNPRREGTHGFKSFALIKNGMTYEQYITAGGRANDLAWDVEKGNVKIKAAAKA